MTCSDEAWHGLWTTFNTYRTDTIRVDRAQLRAVYACHDAKGYPQPTELLVTQPREGSKTVEVNRTVLFKFLRYHGAYCHAA